MTHISPDGARKPAGTGYSGFGSGLDDPAAQDEGEKGPIPRGSWTIGPQQNHKLADGPATLSAAMALTPAMGNTTKRKDFWIHGDTAAHIEATWRRPEQSGRPLGPKPPAAWEPQETLPAREASRQATSGSDQAKSGEPHASQGCIVLPRDARDAIAGSSDPRLEVVYP